MSPTRPFRSASFVLASVAACGLVAICFLVAPRLFTSPTRHDTNQTDNNQKAGTRKNDSSPAATAESEAERAVILLDLGHDLYAFGLGKSTIPDPLEQERVKREIMELHSRLRVSFPEGEVGPDTFKAIRRDLPTEQERECLDIGMHICIARGIGLATVLHKGTEYETLGKQKLPAVARALELALRSLGILEEVEKSHVITEMLMPTEHDTADDYGQRVDGLMATIRGPLTHRFIAASSSGNQ